MRRNPEDFYARSNPITRARYGTFPSSPNWNPNADINNDRKVDIRDVHIAAANYGKHYP